MTTPDPEALRVLALSALGPAGDARARDFLGRAVLEVAPSELHWSGTEGEMSTFRVTLGLDGRSLAVVRSHPAVEDALAGSLSIAVATVKGSALHELALYWGLGESEEALDYRTLAERTARVDPSDPQAMAVALRAYLAGLGMEDAAARLSAATIALRRSSFGIEVTLSAPSRDTSHFRQGEDLAIEAALEDLAAGPQRERVRVSRSGK